MRRHSQVDTSPLCPATTRYALGHDVPPSLGRLCLRLRTTETAGRALSFNVPDVHVLRHTAVFLLLGLHSHKRLRLVVYTPRDTILFDPARRPVLCRLQRVHRTLPLPPPRPAAAPPPFASFFTRSELGLAHRQFRHASVDALPRAFPLTAFTPADVATLRDVARSCISCQELAHLPRRPPHTLPPRPVTFNRVLALDTF